MFEKEKRVFLSPRNFSSKVKRRLVKIILTKQNLNLSFKEIPKPGSRNLVKGFFYLDVPVKEYKNVINLLKKFGIELSKSEEEAMGLFELRVVADTLSELEDGIPIGVNAKRERLVLLPKPIIGVSRDRLTPLFLSEILENVLWIGSEFRGYENFLVLIDKLNIGGLGKGAIFELAKILATKTIGRRFLADFAEKMEREENLLEDEEFIVSSDADRVLSKLRDWEIFDFEKSASIGKHLLDVSGLPRLAVDLAIAIGLNLGYELIVVDKVSFDPKVLGNVRDFQSFIWIDKFSTPNWANFIIDANKGFIVKKRRFRRRTVDYFERFIPLWDVIKGVVIE